MKSGTTVKRPHRSGYVSVDTESGAGEGPLRVPARRSPARARSRSPATTASENFASFVNRNLVAPLASLADGAAARGGTPAADADMTPPSDAAADAERDVSLDHLMRDEDSRGRGSDECASEGRSPTSSSVRRRRARLQRQGTVRAIHQQYEANPLVVWLRMLAQFFLSLLSAVGLGMMAALYPVYAVTPSAALEALQKGAFNVGYLLYTTPVGRYFHLRAVRSNIKKRVAAHSRGIRASALSTCSVLPVPFFNDNYSYLLVDHATRTAAAVDPADPYTIKDVADRLQLTITHVLTTHKHHDHAGGNLVLQKKCGGGLVVCGHRDDKIPGVTKLVRGGDRFFVGRTEVGVVHVPCHTDGHVVYCVIGADAGGEDGLGGGGEGGGGGGGGGGASIDEKIDGGASKLPTHRVEAIFTGDAIINGGVGAFFHGGPKDCYENLHVRLKDMPDAAFVYSGHEYMIMNLRFAKWLDMDDEATTMALQEVIVRRHHRLSTQPSSLEVERRVNPYFRMRDREYLSRVNDLAAAVEAGKRKRWWRRYFKGGEKKEDATREMDEFDGVGVDGGAAIGEVSVGESVAGIKTVQELAKYRHIVDSTSEGTRFRATEAEDEEETENGDETPTSEGGMAPPTPRPINVEMSERR